MTSDVHDKGLGSQIAGLAPVELSVGPRHVPAAHPSAHLYFILCGVVLPLSVARFRVITRSAFGFERPRPQEQNVTSLSHSGGHLYFPRVIESPTPLKVSVSLEDGNPRVARWPFGADTLTHPTARLPALTSQNPVEGRGGWGSLPGGRSGHATGIPSQRGVLLRRRPR